MLAGGDADGRLTAVAVGVAKLGEPAVLAAHVGASSFIGTGRALSVAAGRLSYIHGLKVRFSIISCIKSTSVRLMALEKGGRITFQ